MQAAGRSGEWKRQRHRSVAAYRFRPSMSRARSLISPRSRPPRVRPELLRPRNPAADPDLGRNAGRGPRLPEQRVVGRHGARPSDHADGAGHRSARRWPVETGTPSRTGGGVTEEYAGAVPRGFEPEPSNPRSLRAAAGAGQASRRPTEVAAAGEVDRSRAHVPGRVRLLAACDRPAGRPRPRGGAAAAAERRCCAMAEPHFGRCVASAVHR